MVEDNPYEAPATRPALAPGRGGGRAIYLGWVAVVAFNLIFPLLLGWPMTERSGRAGMAAAVVLVVLLGWRLCAVARDLAALAVVGGALVGLTQLVPGLQIIAGMVGMMIALALRLAGEENDHGRPIVVSEAGGFVVTAITGAILIAVGLVAGLVIRRLTPDRWWRRVDRPGAGGP